MFDLDNLPEVTQAWIRQLVTIQHLDVLIESGGQVEVRLFTNQGKVRKDPVIVLNAGPSTMVGDF